ncbi:hypothetical protein BC835DRAFT_1034400 [Cytidiella melzeri]|nr:hypothetical protein BC835DRAFT_1034400 [Cytidiella melzeri]
MLRNMEVVFSSGYSSRARVSIVACDNYRGTAVGSCPRPVQDVSNAAWDIGMWPSSSCEPRSGMTDPASMAAQTSAVARLYSQDNARSLVSRLLPLTTETRAGMRGLGCPQRRGKVWPAWCCSTLCRHNQLRFTDRIYPWLCMSEIIGVECRDAPRSPRSIDDAVGSVS